MKTHLKCAIDVSHSDNSTVEEILDKIQEYLRQKRNVALDRVAFEERKQLEGESFDHFYVSLKKLSEEGDLCSHCIEPRLVTRIMSRINSIEVRQKLLAITPFPSLKTVVEMCRSQESAVKDSATLSNKIPIDRIKNNPKSWKISNSSEQVKEKCLAYMQLLQKVRSLGCNVQEEIERQKRKKQYHKVCVHR